MSQTNFSEFKFTGSQYDINENNYILATKEDSTFSHKNIIPLLYITEDFQFLEIDKEEIGERLFVISSAKNADTEEISTRFAQHELFKIFRGPLWDNDRHSYDHNLPKKQVHKHYLKPFNYNEIIEIFDCLIDINKSRIEFQNTDFNELISNVYVRTNQNFFAAYQGNIIGPFIITGSDEDGFKAEKGSLSKFGIYDFNKNPPTSIAVNGNERRIFFSLTQIKQSFSSEFEYINDNDLLDWFNTQLENDKNLFPHSKDYDVLIEQLKNSKKIINDNNTERYNRVAKLLSSTQQNLISKQNLIKLIPELSYSKEEIEATERRKLDAKNSLEKSTKALEEIENKMRDSGIDLENTIGRLKVLKLEEQEEQSRIKFQIKNEIEALEHIKSKIESEILSEREEKQKYLSDLKSDINFNERRKSELDTAIETLKFEFTSEQRKAQEKLSELVKQSTHFNFISGRDLSSEDNKLSKYEKFKGNYIDSYVAIRDQISEILKSQQRHLESHFIDNLLISIHQNTLTLLAGPPGTGKTSLAKILATALTDSKRVREIPVSRGWTSQKDFIGFSNPLSKKFHESQTGFYSLLKQIDFEWKEKLYMESPLAIVILDEANLSPLEHYWSIFHSSCDTVAKKMNPLEINLGQNEVISHSNSLRFIGTINYDQTTEELSPRILDRTNVIRILPNNFQIESLSNKDFKALSIAQSELIRIFSLRDFNQELENLDIPDEIQKRYLEIKDLFSKINIYVSPRVEIAIKRYCQLARTIMPEVNRPLDYCVAQRILPLINLQGDKRKELDDILQAILKFNLDNSVSATILKNIISVGSRSGFTQDNYNYFLALSNV